MEEGAAMGSSLSAVVANLYMESFEEQVVYNIITLKTYM